MIIWDTCRSLCIKTYVVNPNLSRLDQTAQMRGHNIWVYMRNKKIFPSAVIKYSHLCRAPKCSDYRFFTDLDKFMYHVAIFLRT